MEATLDVSSKEDLSENKTLNGQNLSFKAEKEVLYNGLKIVERASSQRGLQPVLSNILIEAVDKNKINLYATDFDITIKTSIEAQVTSSGSFTLPARKLIDIVSRLDNSIIEFNLNETVMTITCGKSKFDVLGISASEFPKVEYLSEDDDNVEIELNPLISGIKEAGFIAAGYELNNNLLSGVVCDISENMLEIASTDGNRLARSRKIISNKDGKTQKLIIPSKILQELLKISPYIDTDKVKLYSTTNKIMIKTDNVTMISSLINGQYPQYNQLIPQNFPKTAKINVQKFVSAIERVSTMVNEKTSIIKFEFLQNSLNMKADTPESGNSEDSIDISYSDDDILIAFNYRYLLEGLKYITSETVTINMNTNLSAAVILPDNDDDFIYLIMPVQIR